MQLPKLFNEDWATFFELSHDGIVIADHQGNIVYMNPAAERLEETSKEHILGRTARELLEEGIYQVSVTVKVFESRKTETAMDTKGGRQLILTGVPIFDKKGGIKWVYINERDVTELNQVKRELENDRLQLQQYRNELSRIREETGKQRMIIGKSAKVKQNMELLKRLAPTETLILIEGESGTGKDVHARWIEERIRIVFGTDFPVTLPPDTMHYDEAGFSGRTGL
ncbi:MAG: PAS domain S-box protein [Firmicutes bacterium]|nr:PAS domain S-box protein [Bacillota bacterium]